jgi:hypothetical protein
MSYKLKLKYLKVLFLISILFSILSFFSKTSGGKELYPFFYWKLYTQPLGSNGIFDDYRIYGITEEKDTIRIPNIGYDFFNQDDYYYYLLGEAQKISNQKNIELIQTRLHSFGKNIAPQYEYYILVKEEFNPIELTINKDHYHSTILLSSK